MTLVLAKVERTVRSLWCILDAATLTDAKQALADREFGKGEIADGRIGFWDCFTGESHGRSQNEIRAWAKDKGLDGVVWTNLGPKIQDRYVLPSYQEVLAYLKSLPDSRAAEEYVRRAPVQIDTDYRQRLQADLGWSPL